MNVKPNLDRIVIGYCRVSSNKQKRWSGTTNREYEIISYCTGQTLVEDLVQIITVFSCKLQGKRANKARKLVKELIDDGGEEDDKNNSSHADPK